MTAPSPASATQRTVLLLSPSLRGHRLIYCRVLAGVLATSGHRVVVAGEATDPTVAGDPLLHELERRPGVEIAGTGPADAFTAGAVPSLVARTGADVLFVAEADPYIDVLAANRPLAGRSFSGRTVALFVRSTNYAYRPVDPGWRVVRSRAARRGHRRSAAVGYHERAIARGGGVDAALVLDERFAAEHPHTHRWMPDIYREPPEVYAADDGETGLWQERLESFLAAAGSRPVIAYIGTNQERRGYDTLLRLALEEDGCFIHCGRLGEHDGPDEASVRALRTALRERGALFETGGAYLHPETADLFLRAARCIVLPYRRHDGSSGVMLQALAAGRPVVVPDRGLMAYRARTFGLGTTYRAGDDVDLRRVFRASLSRRPEAYAARLGAFMASFSLRQLAAAVQAALDGRGPGATLPQERFRIAASRAGGPS